MFWNRSNDWKEIPEKRSVPSIDAKAVFSILSEVNLLWYPLSLIWLCNRSNNVLRDTSSVSEVLQDISTSLSFSCGELTFKDETGESVTGEGDDWLDGWDIDRNWDSIDEPLKEDS